MHTPHDNGTINIAIMCGSYQFEKWQARCIEAAASLPYARFVLLIMDDNDTRDRGPLLKRMREYPFRQLFFRLYLRFSASRNVQRVNLENVLKGIPALKCRTSFKGKYSEYFSAEDVQRIAAYQPDVILRFAFNIIKGDILTVARYGVWSYHHDDEQLYRGMPAGFWEIYHDDPVNGAILQRLTEKLDGGIILKKGFFPTIRTSYPANAEQIKMASADWVKQVCIDIHNGAAEYFERGAAHTDAPIYRYPGNVDTLKVALKCLRNRLAIHRKPMFNAGHWNIGIIRQPIARLLETTQEPEITWLPEPPPGTFRADPFPYRLNNEAHVAFENYSYARRCGTIDTVCLDNPAVVQTAIAEEFHLSYPFMVHHDGATYCIPEAYASNSVRLYKLDPETHRWIYQRELLRNFEAIDTTLFHYEGRWWLLCSTNPYPNLHLYAFFADTLDGEYQPHANNPVKTDIRSSRPGGMPFFHDGSLYRPAQDCSRSYGCRIVINRVLSLTPTRFEEEAIRTVGPDEASSYKHGLHTISFMDDLTVVDGKRIEFNIFNFKERLLLKFKGQPAR